MRKGKKDTEEGQGRKTRAAGAPQDTPPREQERDKQPQPQTLSPPAAAISAPAAGAAGGGGADTNPAPPLPAPPRWPPFYASLRRGAGSVRALLQPAGDTLRKGRFSITRDTT